MHIKDADLSVEISEIIPPLSGGQKYAAKVRRVFVIDSNGRREINGNWPEAWGKTEKEAEENLRRQMNDWASSQ